MVKTLLLFALLFLINIAGYSQGDIGMSGFDFSAIFRDSIGRSQIQKPVTLRFTLLAGQLQTPATSPWIETHNTKTDDFGFVNLVFGTGTKTGGTANTFSEVDFSASNYWLLIEVKNDADAYEPFAKQAFQGVAYAKVAGGLAKGSSLPAGTISTFAGDTNHIPQGWLFCNGRAVSKSDPRYKNLFDAIGYNWGTGGLNTRGDLFNIPIISGFLRGAYSLGFDPDADARSYGLIGGNTGNNVGSIQADRVKYHRHYLNTTPGEVLTTNKNFEKSPTTNLSTIIATGNGTGDPAFTAETRPKNALVAYIIKL